MVKKTAIVGLTAILSLGLLPADAKVKEKRTLKGNMTLKYNVLPGEANSLEEMFIKDNGMEG